MRELARAKVNLFLHVLGRRADGYHELESLAAFAESGDSLEATPAKTLRLTIDGPFGPPLLAESGRRPNLVIRAAEALGAAAAFHLTKALPIASGLGGGSADAAAALRLLAGLKGLARDDPALFEAARQVGADIPVCLLSRAAWMGGIGERIEIVPDFPPLPALLVNPGVAVETAAAFAALGLKPGERSPSAPTPPRPKRFESAEAVRAFLAGTRNDLEPAATALAPAIGETLDLLRSLEAARLVRMSGSGATCFALFGSEDEAHAAAERVRAVRPGWWRMASVLR